MDAKERLRLYLEQRRDLGESELVLDSLSVEDVMRIVGAGSGGASRASRGDAPRGDAQIGRGVPADRPERLARPADDAPQGDAPATSPGNWREALRAAEAATAAPRAATPVPPPPVRQVARTDAERAPAPPPSPRRETAGPAAGAVDSAGNEQEVARARANDRPSEERDDDASPDDDVTARGAGGAKKPSAAAPAASHAKIPLDQVPTGLVVGSSVPELFGGEAPYRSLADIAEAVAGCQRCRLYATAKHPVPGEGNPEADLVCVGEAPGANEDESGRPFVGQAGQLLTKILGAIDLAREDVFIVNVLKHRPPANRNPMPDEVTACSPYLVRQIELIKPKVIVAFGTFAAQTLLQTKEPIGKLRGSIHRYHGVPLIVTYHPAALLRNPAWKRPTWEDVQLARRLLDRAREK